MVAWFLLADQFFRIDEQDIECLRVSFTRFFFILLCRIARSTRDRIPFNSFFSSGFNQIVKEQSKTFSEIFSPCFLVSSAFDVNPYFLYHRLPPISPINHTSPNEYLFSHSFRGSFSSRRKWLPWSSRSQTRTLSGTSVSAEMRMSEWVVTMSCVRCEASMSNSAIVESISGCRPNSGSSRQIRGGGFG